MFWLYHQVHKTNSSTKVMSMFCNHILFINDDIYWKEINVNRICYHKILSKKKDILNYKLKLVFVCLVSFIVLIL